MTLPVFEVSGTPAARGEAYGRQAAALIDRAVAHYRRDLEAVDFAWEDVKAVARRFGDAIAGFDADLAEEIEAIALGSDQPTEAIVLLNARTEMLFWRARERSRADADGPEAEGCTSALAMPGITADGRLIHGQNWDWRPEVADHAIALKVRSDDGPDALHVVEAGQLARHGLNSAGIAVTAMGLHSGTDYGQVGVPSPIIRRRVLQALDLGSALGAVFEHPASFSHALIISHADGEAFCLEATPGEVFWQEPDDGVLVHANHFKNPQALARLRDANLARCPDSLYRDSRVRRHLRGQSGKITAQTFKDAFADRFGAPNSILRSPAGRPQSLLSATVYTLIMCPADRTAEISLRPYEAGSSFQQLSLD